MFHAKYHRRERALLYNIILLTVSSSLLSLSTRSYIESERDRALPVSTDQVFSFTVIIFAGKMYDINLLLFVLGGAIVSVFSFTLHR